MAEAQSQILSLGEQLVALAGHNSLDDQPIEQRPRNPRLSVDGSESVSSSLPARRRPPVDGPPVDGDEKLGERTLSSLQSLRLNFSGFAPPSGAFQAALEGWRAEVVQSVCDWLRSYLL